jgi:hypothetical protein
MAVRDGCDAALPAGCAAAAARHLGGGPGLVDEHQPIAVVSGWSVRQAARCAATSARSCSPACAVFFEGDGAAIEEPPNHARHEALAVRLEQMAGDLLQRDVRLGLLLALLVIYLSGDEGGSTERALRAKREAEQELMAHIATTGPSIQRALPNG